MNWSDRASVIAVALALLTLLWQMAVYLSRQHPALSMGIRVLVDTQENPLEQATRAVMIRCELGNTGNHKLSLREAKLLIDQGAVDKSRNEIRYPTIWQWNRKCPDCELSRWFQTHPGDQYPGYVNRDEIEGKYTSCTDMYYFVRAIEYVQPNERFTDAKVLYLAPGEFYRATFVAIPRPIRLFGVFSRRVDCLCVTTQIPPGVFREV